MYHGKTAVICQCRTSSRRLRNKLFLKVKNKPIIYYLIKRLEKINCDDIIFAIAEECGKNKLFKLIKGISPSSKFFFGSKENVLDRTIKSAEKFNISKIIRITSDCPLIDPNIVNKGISKSKKINFDYLSNNMIKSFPHGLDFEIVSLEALKKSMILCKDKRNFEHVTWYIKRSKLFKKVNIANKNDKEKKIRLTLDYKTDYQLIKCLIEKYPIIVKDFDKSTLCKIYYAHLSKKK